ncbi:MAG TPA: hypothetical protein DDW50_01305 [Firmicutes bacterium]|jgi:predicted short-subunit dehydrogenase-like oxidoreductase (DUF2520 family)|nr:hypothetical protein [Bacillota bacterium]
MKVGFIGAGKVALAMGNYWLSKGVAILGYSSRNMDSAQKHAVLTNTRAFTSPAALAEEATLIMITTSDDAILSVAETLAGFSLPWEQKIVCHMSGAHSSQLLSSLSDKGATICSFHPMISFGTVPMSGFNLDKAFFTFEGTGQRLKDIESFLHFLGHRYELIDPDQKVLYHTAACVLSNYFVTLLNTGMQMLKRSGISQENMMDCLKPLIEKTWENVLKTGPESAMTGPISRGDARTIQLHLESLLKEGRSDWLEIYKTMGKATVELAVQAGRIDPETADNLYKELQ